MLNIIWVVKCISYEYVTLSEFVKNKYVIAYMKCEFALFEKMLCMKYCMWDLEYEKSMLYSCYGLSWKYEYDACLT